MPMSKDQKEYIRTVARRMRDLSKVNKRIKEAKAELMAAYNEWEDLYINCDYRGEFIGICNNPDNCSCSVTPCNGDDCPL